MQNLNEVSCIADLLEDLDSVEVEGLPVFLGFYPDQEYVAMREMVVAGLRAGENMSSMGELILAKCEEICLKFNDEIEESLARIGAMVDKALIWRDVGRDDVFLRDLYLTMYEAKRQGFEELATYFLNELLKRHELRKQPMTEFFDFK